MVERKQWLAPGEEHLGPGEGALLAGIAVLALLLCLPATQGLTFVFQNVEFYAHGYLVPAVAAYLVVHRRAALLAAIREPAPPRFGALVVFAAASFQLLMTVGDVATGAGLGIPLVLASVAYGVGGERLLRPLALPLGFLAVAVPPPGFVMNELLTHLKAWVTGVAVHLLQLAGEPVLADGNRIDVPGHSLFVADACSGLTSIVTLLPIACVVAYFLGTGTWRRLVIIASVVPLAMGANILRVFGTVKLVSWVGIEAAQGALHESFGYMTFVLGTLALGLIARLLR